jgi:hypothetical protein
LITLPQTFVDATVLILSLAVADPPPPPQAARLSVTTTRPANAAPIRVQRRVIKAPLERLAIK